MKYYNHFKKSDIGVSYRGILQPIAEKIISNL